MVAQAVETFVAGDTAGAAGQLVDAIAVARHFHQGRFAVELLSAIACEAGVMHEAAALMPLVERKSLERLRDRVAALPPPARMGSHSEVENTLIRYNADRIRAAFQKPDSAEALEAAAKVLVPYDEWKELRAELVRTAGGKMKQMTRLFEEWDAQERAVHAAMQMDYESGMRAARKLDEAAAKSANPLIRFRHENIPAANVTRIEHCQIALRAMFAAGMDVVLNGEAALAKHADPTNGKPFVFRKVGKAGFSLSCAVTEADGTPYSIVFGTERPE